MKFDAVILWVDGNDPKWQEEYNKYCKPASRIENGVQRYRDWDTLRYVIRGIEYNL
ncbi:Stealth CR1 domain-containing protein, partial [Escherichia coli]